MRREVNENNVKTREDNAYKQKYGKIPDDHLERISYILGNKAKNEKYNLEIQKAAKQIKRIKRHKIQFTFWKVIKPSARPRATMRSGYIQMYVPNAAANGKWFEEYFKQSDLPRIDTPCTVEITVYEQTPTAFNKKQTVLAELGILRPWKRTGDFDNYAKTITDMLQHGMLADDCLIVSSRVELMYSIKPRCDIVIEYMDEFPSI